MTINDDWSMFKKKKISVQTDIFDLQRLGLHWYVIYITWIFYKNYAARVFFLFKFWIACYSIFSLFCFLFIKNRKEMNEIPCISAVGEWCCSTIRQYNKNNNNNNEVVEIYVKSVFII